MKRSWIGFGLLAVLLAVSVVVTGFMGRIHEEMVLDLKQSSECARLSDWDNAALFLERANRNWEKWDHLRSCFANHQETEAIDASLSALDVLRQSKDATAYRASCAALTKQVEAMGEAHKLTWWNVF